MANREKLVKMGVLTGTMNANISLWLNRLGQLTEYNHVNTRSHYLSGTESLAGTQRHPSAEEWLMESAGMPNIKQYKWVYGG
jgi:hypothetical protein